MMSFDSWPGQQPVVMVPHSTHRAQSREADNWETACGTWKDYMQQEHHSSPEEQCQSMKASGCKRGGRPVTWIGGGGMDPKRLAGLGVPVLRTLFSQVFGQETASNNAAWLRRKLAEAPDSVHGQRRSPVVRARDQGAAIWNQDQELMAAEEGSGQPDLNLQQQQQQPSGVFAAHPGALSGLAEQVDMSLEQQMQLDGVTTMSEAAHTTHTSTSAGCTQALATACPSAALACSPVSTLGKRSRQGTAKALVQQTADGGLCAAGVPLGPDTIRDSCSGRKVLVYWPDDQQWWEATLCRVDTRRKHLQLLYADMTEECVSDRDYDDMLTNGHLMDVQDVHTLSTGQDLLPEMIPLDKAQSAPEALRSTLPMGQSLAPGGPCPQDSLSQLSGPDYLGHQAASRSQSCQLPLSDPAAGSTGTGSALQHSSQPPSAGLTGAPGISLDNWCRQSPEAAGEALTHNSSRRSTRDGFRFSSSGTSRSGGSGNNSASCDQEGEARGLAAKRQCVELSGSSSDDAAGEAINMAVDASGAPAAAIQPGAAPAAQQQQQQKAAGDPAQLSLWFANQQLQQLHLQEQVQHNMELQQQAHLQMQQQMAAHMQLRMAGQIMQQQMAASPFGFAGAAVAAAAAAGMFGLPVNSACMNLAAVSAGVPSGLPPISAPPNAFATQQLAAFTAAAAAGQVGSPLAAMVYGSPCGNGAEGGPGGAQFASSGAFAMNPVAVGQAQQQQQQLFQQAGNNIIRQLLETNSPLAAAAAATWPNPGSSTAPMDSSAAAAYSSPRAAMAAVLPGQLVATVQPPLMFSVQQLQQAAGVTSTAAVAAAGPDVYGQMPLPQLQPAPQAPLQPALPDSPAAFAPAAMAAGQDWQGQAEQHAAASKPGAAAAAPSKPSKAVSINPNPEYCTLTQNWVNTAYDSIDNAAVSVAQAGLKQQGVAARTDPACAAAPTVSGTTAGCVSGFTGGVQGGEALDEVDILLSRPEDGLFGGGCEGGLDDCGSMDNDGCGGCGSCGGCWGLLGISGGGESSQQEGAMCRDGPGDQRLGLEAALPSSCCVPQRVLARDDGASGCDRPALTAAAAVSAGATARVVPPAAPPPAVECGQGTQGGPAAVSLAPGQWAELCAVLAPPCAPTAMPACGRPNSALAHVFDYA